ncbi:MAG: hypothetical protein P9M11_02915 [Candidatus Tenebribacter burtonii]|jgi:PHD/YefM family antitoxin component YafN of YafNO toxin-antitoxin module|nr:hypothetical protein [Candidatus Tenebribacter burtonii]
MKTYNIELIEKRFEELIDLTIDHDNILRIKTGKGNAIIISETKWKSIKETLFLLSISGMRELIKKGMNTPLAECSEELEWKKS